MEQRHGDLGDEGKGLPPLPCILIPGLLQQKGEERERDEKRMREGEMREGGRKRERIERREEREREKRVLSPALPGHFLVTHT